jgi:hypothetical protein
LRRFGTSFGSISSPIVADRTIDHPINRSRGRLGPVGQFEPEPSVDPG